MRRQELAHHEYPFLFLFVVRILCRLVTRLDVRSYEVNRRCQIVLGRVVLALSDIPSEVRQDELTDVKLQAKTPSQPKFPTRFSKRGEYQSIFTD